MPIPNRYEDHQRSASPSSDKNKITYALALFVAALTGYNVDLVLVIVRTLFGL